MKILEDLWHGNIYPSEEPIKKGGEYAQALHWVVDEKEALLPTLSPEIQKTIDKLMDVQMDAAVIAERDAFVMGFKLATRILVAAISDSE